ncbi:diacylglycerol kinase [Candidatus Halobeggiatoa sp. HSG11]|nr:diacylglycerol kinase [Candidatus Halobeggiatoa sp. HSG11]
MKHQYIGITRLIKAFGYSLEGFKATWINEAAFRQELLVCIILIPLGFYLGNTNVEKVLLISSLLLVLMMELLNSAIEAVSDCITEERHPLIKRAKDIGAAAVLMAICNSTVVWGVILYP